MDGLNWTYIAISAAGPPCLALLAAWPLWRKDQMILGNIAGTVIIFATAMALIFTEHVYLDREVGACLEAGIPCWPTPGAFTRYAIYAAIALAEIIALFWVSLGFEERKRRRAYSGEWR